MRGRYILPLEPKGLNHRPSSVKIMENVDLEEAMDIAGAGKYQLFHSVLMLFSILASMFEIIGIAYVLPAAACDLHLPDSLRGIITSISNIGIIITAPFWGCAADFRGRRPVLLFCSAMAGALALLAAFMPNLTGFAICKFASSLFLSCPSSLGFAYACEMLPMNRRDSTVLIGNGILLLLSTLCPIFAWIILPYQWRFQIGVLVFRPWRLLTVVFAVPLIVVAIWTYYLDESPKFLASKGRWQDVLTVLRKIYAYNTGMSADNYCVKSLKSTADTESAESLANQEATSTSGGSAMALLRPPHLKWLALTGFLMLGLFSLLNGLFLFAPDTINKVMNGSSEETGTLCTLINHNHDNSSRVTTCNDTISKGTFQIVVITSIIYGVIVLVGSMIPLSKRTLLVTMFATVGVACLVSGLTTNRMLAGAAMSSLQLTSLGIGPLTAYAVHLFPTNLRGTAVGAVMMFGRVGSAAGANAAGYFLATACTATFYGFTALLFYYILPISVYISVAGGVLMQKISICKRDNADDHSFVPQHVALDFLQTKYGFRHCILTVCAALSFLLPGESSRRDSTEATR